MSGLAGKRVLVTRPAAQSAGLIERLLREGALPVAFPTIEIAPLADGEAARLDRAIASLAKYRWVIFTSVNGVEALWGYLAGKGRGKEVFAGAQVAAIGPATAESLKTHGVTADLVPPEYRAEAILPGLGEVQGQRILLLRADIARKALFEELERRGGLPEEIAVYRTVPAHPDEAAYAELEHGIDVATFTSSSTVRGFFELCGDRAMSLLEGAAIACIGPVTAETARSLGLTVHVTADEYTADGLVEALLAYFH